MPLVLTNKLFKSPLGLFFECCGIARAVPVITDKIEVFIDFHIYTILQFDILICYPLENLIQENPSQGSLNEIFGKPASTTHSDIPVAEHHPNSDPFEEVNFISPFVSLSCETKHPSSPLLKPKPCPAGRQDVVLHSSQDSTLIPHNENFCDMDMLLSAPCPYEDSNHLLILVSKLFRRMVVDAYVY